MRGRSTTGVCSAAIAAVGAALVATGATTDDAAESRAGLGLLVAGLACLMMHMMRCNTARLIAHQEELARVTKTQQQEWAERGYRAGEIDTLSRLGVPQHETQILVLPPTGSRQRRRTGA